ncbi:uncharacterized protein [Drosophila virilis]|uniref:Tudor domain-containing protein n=1 Tax=Drosophila virilis TaxID=7244 RepID=B4M6U5_DROVI|nr:uncharacterized protein LOC6633741 [Drosophila virilis]EDW62512.2 uncharacterized protein Dvir_GJ16574 [Drosophila virilis]
MDIQDNMECSAEGEQLKSELDTKMAASYSKSVGEQLVSAAVLARQLKAGTPVVKLCQEPKNGNEAVGAVSAKRLKSGQTSSSDSGDQTERKYIDLLPQTVRKYNHLEAWLGTLDYRTVKPVMMMMSADENMQEPGEGGCIDSESNVAQRLAQELWAIDSDEDEPEQMTDCTNPFRFSLTDNQQTEQILNTENLSAERQMNNFIQLIQSRAAVPEYALSDAVYCVDKPKEAAALGAELPLVPISESFKIGDLLKLFVSEVYSPFQFWFHVVGGDYDMHMLEQLNHQLTNFYSTLRGADWQLPSYFMKPGYMCAVLHEFAWRRGRIVSEPLADADHVSVYLLDYGKGVNVQRKELYFLHGTFKEQPALLMRGTLTDVYPLDLHWPENATTKFKQLVHARELHAVIKDIDIQDRILFVNLFNKSSSETTTISDLLIEAKMAGRSQNYSAELRAANCGRRLRYLRERLPTFDMLETQVFPTATDDFEEKFDNIIYMPTFFQQFQPPQLTNPFLHDLQEALANWLVKFQPEEMAWRKLNKEAHKKLKQEQQKRLQQFLTEHPNFFNELTA